MRNNGISLALEHPNFETVEPPAIEVVTVDHYICITLARIKWVMNLQNEGMEFEWENANSTTMYLEYEVSCLHTC